jgi:hypothetical protein
MVLMCTGSVNAAERWAALAASSETATPVVWGDSRQAAAEAAAQACNSISQTCAPHPVVTSDMKAVFVEMCCTVPQLGCVAGVGKSASAASHNAKAVFDNAGYSSCKVARTLRASDGAAK